MATYYTNFDLAGLGGIGSPTDPKGSDFLYQAQYGDTLKAIGSITLSGDLNSSAIIEPWISGVPWRINANDKYLWGLYSFYGGIVKSPLFINTINEASGCALIDIKAAGSWWVTNPGNLTNSLLNFTTGKANASSAATLGNVTNCLIVEPSGGYGSFYMFSNTSDSNILNTVTNAPSTTGIFKETPLTNVSGTINAPFVTGSIPVWSGTADLQNFCLGYYASGIGPTNFASGYWVRFISELSGAAPLELNFSGITNIPSSGTIFWTYNTDSTTTSGSTGSHIYNSTGVFPITLSSYYEFPTTAYSGFSTFIYDSFSGGAFDSWWNPDATGAFTVYSSVSGYAARFNNGNTSENMRMLTPWGTHLSGNFDVQTRLLVTGVLGSVWPSIGILTISGDTGLEGQHFIRQGYDAAYEAAEVHAAGSGYMSGYCRVDLESFQTNISFSPQLTYSGVNRTVDLRLQRTNGVISGSYRDGGAGSWMPLSGSVSYSGLAVLEINGAAWADFLNINAMADGGLPYFMSGVSIYKRNAPPEWVYMNGYVYDSFASSGFSQYWHNEFLTSSWDVADVSGFVVYSTSTWHDNLLYPSGSTRISGAFDFQWEGVSLGAYPSASGISEIQVEYDGGETTEIEFGNGRIRWNNSPSSDVNYPATTGFHVPIRLTRGVRINSSGTPTLESISSGIHGYYFDNCSGTATYTWREFIGSPYTGAGTTSGMFFSIQSYNAAVALDNFKVQTNSPVPAMTGATIEAFIGTSGTVASSGFASFSEQIVVYLPGTDITGLVEGQGYIYSIDTYEDFISGLVEGYEKINGLVTFIYPPTDDPPTSSGTTYRSIKPILTNKNRYPYKVPHDTIVSKIDILKDGRLSYLSGIPVELWMNYSGSWIKCEDAVTDRYGSCYISHSTSGIPNITNCLGIVKATYGDGFYVSNIMRYNFYSGEANIDLIYIIDAAATGMAPDRVNHDIFEGSGRLNLFDRMYYI